METNVPEQEFGNGRGLVKKCRDAVLQNSYLATVISAVVLGITLGLVLKFYIHISEHDKQYIDFPGKILMEMVQLMIVPLLLTNLITGASGFKAHRVIDGRATAYFLSTTLMSLSIGIFLVMMFEPGSSPSTEDIQPFFNIDCLMDIIRNMVPTWPIQASCRQLEYESDEFNSSVDTNMTEIRLLVKYVDGINILAPIVWALIFRVILNRIGKDGKALVDVFQAINEVTKRMVDMILNFLPIGVLFLTTSHVIEYDNVTTIFQIGKFMALVIIGLIIHSTIVLPLTYFLCTRCNPYDVIKEIVPALKKALVSSSSVNTLPLTTQCCESRLMIDTIVTQYMLPIGTNIITDRCNSFVNVLGNCIGVAIVHEVSKGQLGEMDQGPSTPRVQIVDDEELSLDQVLVLAEFSPEEHCQDEEHLYTALEYQIEDDIYT